MTETRTITATLTAGAYAVLTKVLGDAFGRGDLPDDAVSADVELTRAWAAAGPSPYPVRDAAARLRRLEAEHGRDGDPLEDIFNPAVRSLLLEDPDADLDLPAALEAEVRGLLATLAGGDPEGQEELTRLALDHSLCPLHLVDYAICFDDEDPECAAIRMIHPCHDT